MNTDNARFLEKAKQLVYEYSVEKFGLNSIKPEDIYIVWFCKTLQNWKALASTDIPDDMYYEITYNGDKKEIYFDAYKKKENRCIPCDMGLTL